MKNLFSKHLFNCPYSDLTLASEIYVDIVTKKTMWFILTEVSAISTVAILYILYA